MNNIQKMDEKGNMYKDDGFYEEYYEDFAEGKGVEQVLKELYVEIQCMNQYLAYLHELIPMRYKKFNPGSGQNPFFSKADIQYTPEEGAAAKKRMEALLRRPGEGEFPVASG